MTRSSGRTAWLVAVVALVLCSGAVLSPTALAANCGCYYSTDCTATPPEGQEAYCDWQADCTRHCELQTNWDSTWGQPPTSKADCDKYKGPCHDDLPVPKNGDDGDGENCEPPTAKTPQRPPQTVNFKVRDGNCSTRKKTVPVPPQQQQVDEQEVNRATDQLVDTANNGGGTIELPISEYMRSVMHNLGILALGQYDYSTPVGRTPEMGDVRGTCGALVLDTLGRALVEEIRTGARRHGSSFKGIGRADHAEDAVASPRGYSARELIASMPQECVTWVQSRAHNCKYPHPAAHHHTFEYPDGVTCIADQIGAMAASLGY